MEDFKSKCVDCEHCIVIKHVEFFEIRDVKENHSIKSYNHCKVMGMLPPYNIIECNHFEESK